MSFFSSSYTITFERCSVDRQDSKVLKYNCIPKQVSRKDVNRYIKPYLKIPIKGPKPKLSFYKLFNCTLYVLHTGVQWNQLQMQRNEFLCSSV